VWTGPSTGFGITLVDHDASATGPTHWLCWNPPEYDDPDRVTAYQAALSRDRRAAIFVYDGYPGGVGLARSAYDDLEGLLANTRDLLADCGCADGCPSCPVVPLWQRKRTARQGSRPGATRIIAGGRTIGRRLGSIK